MRRILTIIAILVFMLSGATITRSQATIGFSASNLLGENINNPTTLQFGPDGRLYAAQQDGKILVYTIARTAPNTYNVTATETISLVQNIQNYNDDGTANSTKKRQVTGLLVVGTATNPVLYVSSSDWRIAVGSDSNLDTNSGTISRLTWNGSSWQMVHLVRGLPRNEENHATNGLALDPVNNLLYIAQGGNTNMGAPSNNFAFQPEYALSAAVLVADLDVIGNSTYDIPTLDDPSRTNSAPGVDQGDPFGGNNGNNQARWVVGGPVQVFAGGFRNPYDVIISESGRIYTVDNGSNQGWGGPPINEGPGGNCTNAPNELNSASHPDGLHLLSLGYYGGHPAPVRGNPDGLYASEADSPVPFALADPVECDYQIRGVEDSSLTTWPASSNGFDEYTASNFGGQLTGDLLVTSFDSNVYRVVLNAAGTQAVSNTVFFSNIGGVPLDLTAQGNTDIFPGTVWVANYVSDSIQVFEPSDYDGGNPVCTGADNPALDEDNDGYDNADEIDNNTDPCNGGSKPQDNDNDLTSDLNDTDDDNDGILDRDDAFQIDATNGTNNTLPVASTLFNNDPGTGFFGVGFGGLMIQPPSGPFVEYLTLWNPLNMTVGGATGRFTVDSMPPTNALGAQNNQSYAFQLGVNTTTATGPFTYQSRIEPPYFNGATPQGSESLGIYIGNGDQDNYLKLVVAANSGNPSFEVVLETNGTPTSAMYPVANLLSAPFINVFLSVDPVAGTVQPRYSLGSGTILDLGSPITLPSGSPLLNVIQGPQSLAIGFIATSQGGAPFAPTWDRYDVRQDLPSTLEASPSVLNFPATVVGQTVTQTVTLRNAAISGGDISLQSLNLTGDAAFSIVTNPPLPFTLQPNLSVDVDIRFTPTTPGAASGILYATHSGVNSPVAVTINGTGLDALTPVYRVNAGGPAITATPLNWAADTAAAPSIYSNVASAVSDVFGSPATINMTNPSVPAGTPMSLLQTQRFDKSGGGNMIWQFPVSVGSYRVRLYFAEVFINTVGGRVFDVQIENTLVMDNFDIFAEVGQNTAVVKTFDVSVLDDNLTITFLRGVQNPFINAIEILPIGGSPEPDGILGVAPTNLPFGDIQVGSSSEPQPVTLTNTATTGNLTINSVTLGGTDSNQFSLTPFSPVTLTPGQSTTVGVTFIPTSAGLKSATISIAHDGSNPSPQTVTLSGTGTTASGTTWTVVSGTNNPTARHENGFIQVNGLFYLIGGRGNKAVNIYNPATNSWSVGATPPVEIHHIQAVEYNGLIYVLNGYSGACCSSEFGLANVYIYNPANNTWTTGPAIPEARRRGSSGTVVYNNRIYVVGGLNGGHGSPGTSFAFFDEFDPATGNWTQLPNAPRVRDHFNAVVIGNKLYAAGGRDSSHPSIFNITIPQVDVYDFGTGTWSTLPSGSNIPTPRAGTSSVALNNLVLVIGGESGTQTTAHNEVQALDPSTGTWQTLPSLNTGRHGTQATICNNRVYIVAGSGQRGGSPELNSMEMYAPSGSGTCVPSLSAVLSAAPNPVGFGNVTVGGNGQQTVVLTHTGATGSPSITINSVSITGTNNLEFTATLTTPVVLTQGQTVNVPVTFAPTSGGAKSAVLNVTHTGTNPSPLTINLSGTGVSNTAPSVTNPGNQTTVVNTPVTLNMLGSDPDAGQTLTWSATGLPVGLTINPTTGVISGTPTVVAVSNVTVTATDNGSPVLNGSIQFTWTVNPAGPVNNPPVVTNPGNQTTVVNTPVTLNMVGSDPDAGQTLTWSATGLPVGLTINPTTGVISGTPTVVAVSNVVVTATDNGSPVLNGTAAFTWTVNAGAPTIGVTSFTLINAVTDLPVAGFDPIPNGATINLAAIGTSNLNIRANVTGSPIGGVVFTYSGTPATRNENGAPYALAGDNAGNYNNWVPALGTFTLRGQAFSGPNGTGTAYPALTITLTFVNNAGNSAPSVTNPGNQTTVVNTPVTLNMLGSDPNAGQTLTWSATGLPVGLSINPTTGAITGTPTVVAVSNVTVTATDNGSPVLSGSISFTWTVNAAANNPPVVTNPGNQTTVVNTPVTLNIVGSDPNAGQTLTWSATGLPVGLTINPTTGVISGTPTVVAVSNVTVTATDNGSPVLNGSVLFTWTINPAGPVNNPPVVTNPGNQTTVVNTPVTLNIVGSDPNAGQTLTWSATGLPVGLTINPTTGVITGTPTVVAVSNVVVTATDNGSPVLNGTAAFTWTVNAAAPTIGVTSFTLINAVTDLPVAGFDPIPNGATINLAAIGTSNLNIRANVTGSPIGGVVFTYSGTPASRNENGAPYALAGDNAGNYNNWVPALGTFTLRGQAFSGPNGTGTAYPALTITLTFVNGVVNSAPSVTNPGNQVTTVNTPVTLNMLGSDPNAGQTLTWSATGLPVGLTINPTTGAITGTPTVVAVTNVVVTATDNGSPVLNGTAAFTWTVNPAAPVNNPPSVTNPGNQVTTTNTPVTMNMAGSDPDAGQTLTWSATGLPVGLTINPTTGAITGTPTVAAVSNVVVTATDNGSPVLNGTAAFTWTVNAPANSAPVVTNPFEQKTTVNTPVTMNMLGSDPNVGQMLSWSATGLPVGLNINPTTGSITGTPTILGTSMVMVTATDNGSPVLSGSTSFIWIITLET